MDTDLRYVAVNPALERINGLSTEDHVDRNVSEILPRVDTGAIESAQWRVLETGVPLLDQNVVGRTWADPDHDHAWSVSLYQLQDPAGQVRGVAASITDVTERHRLATEA
ncbi:PAS domain-containing protein, partial [Streptomyces carpinensis]